MTTVDGSTAGGRVDAGRRPDGLSRPPRRLSAATWQWIVVLIPVVVLVAMAWDRRWMSDDGFIHLRVVDQLVHGNGPVFNAGERVEASTSPLWVALLAAASPITSLALPWKAVMLGIVLAAAGVVAAQRAAAIFARASGHSGIVWPVGAVVIAALPPFWDFATSGLETGLVFAWIGASHWWLARRTAAPKPPRRRVEAAGAVLVGLGFLVRPDLALFTLAFGAVLVAANWSRGWRGRLGVAGAIATVPVAFQIFRMGYYAMTVPNTAVAKEASGAQWASGWQYVTDFVVPYALWLPLALAIVVVAVQLSGDLDHQARLRAAARLAPVAAAIVHALYITRVGGDFMHARLLLPAVFGLVAPIGIVLPAARHATRRRLVVGTALAILPWALACAVFLRPGMSGTHPSAPPVFTSDDQSIADERKVYQAGSGMEHPVRLDRRARAGVERDGPLPERGTAVGISLDDYSFARVPLRADFPVPAAGRFATPAYIWGPEVHIIHTGALAHPVGSRLDQMVGNRMGHQKRLSLPWQLADLTTASEVVDENGRVVVGATDFAAAQHAVTCGQLGRYLDDIHAPLTPARFVGNIFDSFANTALRVPPDPVEAEAQLCGD